MAECSKCGDCCEAIPFQLTKKEMREMDVSPGHVNEENISFILKHWRRISRKKFVQKHPEAIHTTSKVFYTCTKWDPETRLCTARDERPPVCSDYPWYGGDPEITQRMLPARCSFWADVPEESRPVWVTLTAAVAGGQP